MLYPQLVSELGVFAHNVKEGEFFWEMLKAQLPGSSDTSLVATDNINNPNAINPIFLLGARLAEAEEETLSGKTLLLPVIRDAVKREADSVTMRVDGVVVGKPVPVVNVPKGATYRCCNWEGLRIPLRTRFWEKTAYDRSPAPRRVRRCHRSFLEPKSLCVSSLLRT